MEKVINRINITQNGRIKVLIPIMKVFQINRAECELLNKEEDSNFVEMINALKNHQILLGWYINDEMRECFNEHIRNQTLTVHELDPDHPIVTVTNKKNTQAFINTTDVFGMDCYRIGTIEKTENLNCYETHNDAYNGLLKSKPM